MKKVTLMALVAVVAVSVQADLLDWNWTTAYTAPNGSTIAPTGVAVFGDGAGWLVEATGLGVNSSSADGSTVGGFAPFNGSYLMNPFSFNATDASTVTLKLYDATTVGGAAWFLESNPVVLPDNPDTAPPVNAITFNFSGQEWQAIPEPATIGLMGIAGLGMFLARRKVRI